MSSVRTILYLCALMLLPNQALGINPEERLDDPALEERAREISANVRCVVCQNQSIDDSEASIALDLRIKIRQLLVEGQTDEQILTSLQQTYGDFVLLSPPIKSETYLLWLSPIFIVLIGGLLLWRQIHSGQENTPITDSATVDKTSITAKPLSKGAILSTFASALVITGGLYFVLGRPELPPQPLSNRADEIAKNTTQIAEQQREAQQNLQNALADVENSPNDIQKWFRVFLNAQFAENIRTELRAISEMQRLNPQNASLIAFKADALRREADGQMTLPVRELIREALRLDLGDPWARNLAGLAAFQDQEYTSAIEIWQDLLLDSQPNAPWIGIVQKRIDQAIQLGGTPPDQDIPTPEEQQEMIMAMVEGLADRLKDEPNDLDGWLRLAQSYKALERNTDMIDALLNIARLRSGDWDAQLAPLENILALGLSESYVDEAKLLLSRLRTIDPNRSEYLFFAGQYAKINGNVQEAKVFWQRLLDKLPKDAPIIDSLKLQIDELG